MLSAHVKALVRIVESKELPKPKGFENEVEGLLKKALKPMFSELYAAAKDSLSVARLRDICKQMGMTAPGNKKDILLRNMVVRAFILHREDELKNHILELEKNRKSAEALYGQELGLRSKAKIYSEAWLKEVCSNLGVSAGVPRKQLFVEAVTEVFLQGKSDQFLKEMKRAAQAEPAKAEEVPAGNLMRPKARVTKKAHAKEAPVFDPRQLQEIYTDVCGRDLQSTRERLERHFPDSDEFEAHFKAFVSQFGIEQNKPRRRDLWLQRVAEELTEFHTAAKYID